MNDIPADFTTLIQTLTAWLAQRPVTPALAEELTAAFPPESELFRELGETCKKGLTEGWLGVRGEPPLRYGRVIKPSSATQGYSIDVVLMDNIVGPQHTHPNGEIDMIIPVDSAAQFDGHGVGWVVYGPGSSHAPAVTGGAAAVLYALPEGAIRF